MHTIPQRHFFLNIYVNRGLLYVSTRLSPRSKQICVIAGHIVCARRVLRKIMYLQTDGQKCHTIIRPSGKRGPNDFLYFYSLMDIEVSRKVYVVLNKCVY